jgi:hypothetical protein
MAWTVSVVKKTVFGDMRVNHLKCTADAATYNVETGLSKILGVSVCPGSLSTAGIKAYANSGAGGTSLAGILGCSGFVSGDVMYVTVFGT